MRMIAILAVLALTACAPQAPDDRADTGTVAANRPLPGPSEGGGEGLAAVELCKAKDYRHLVGQSVAAASFPQSPNLRVFGVNDIVTQDYIPQRTNIVHDDASRIVRVYCG